MKNERSKSPIVVEPPSMEEIEQAPPEEKKVPKKRAPKKETAKKVEDHKVDAKDVLEEILAEYTKSKKNETVVEAAPKKRAYTKKADKIQEKLVEEPVVELVAQPTTRRIRRNIRSRKN